MTATTSNRLLALLAVVAALCGSVPAHGQMIPLADGRKVSAHAEYGGATDQDEQFPPAPFAYWNVFINPMADTDAGEAHGSSFQVSEFFPGGINFSGTTGGAWSGTPSGTYGGLSLARFDWRTNTCLDYNFHAWLDPGDLVDLNAGEVILGGLGSNVMYQHLENTGFQEVIAIGRLAPGDYYLEGRSSFSSSNLSTSAPTYSLIWTCLPCQNPLIGSQPGNLTIACGGVAVFSIVPTLPGSTYQWRRNGVPLTNSSHIAGATTPMLTVNNACTPDTGYYDAVLTNVAAGGANGPIVEPSRLAHLGVTTVSAVETPSEGPARAFSIRVAGPNPFSGRMSFRYNAAMPLRATIVIYNAAGARIRTLTQGVVSGSGMVTWDGNLDSGARAPAGIYFLRAEAGSIRESRKVVLVR